jgi:2-C-methyl-D-erythritol 4-phosphate cytidylyltransferase/2-C-methyl-D-erythritol 2,4-cyclodiphosphate synthase
LLNAKWGFFLYTVIMKQTWAILVAGGTGNRFGSETPKQFLPLGKKRVLDYSLELFCSLKDLAGVVLVLPTAYVEEWRQALRSGPYASVRVVAGGESRQQSVTHGLKAVAEGAEWVMIHDVARPLVTEEVVRRCWEGARETGAAVAATAVADTLKKGDENRLVLETVPRDGFYQIQTPQVFAKKILDAALKWAEKTGVDATDEATLVELSGGRVRLVEGDARNFKITRSEDLELAEKWISRKEGPGMSAKLRIGEGYDVHPFAEGRDLILGGVKIPFEKGLQGHSDADALLHAVGDALLGAVAAGDLGAHFPDSDERWRGVSSLEILKAVSEMVEKKGFQVVNIDATLVCQRPKLAPYLQAMRENISRVLKIAGDCVSVKATTEEGLGFTGNMQGLAAKAVVLLQGKGS